MPDTTKIPTNTSDLTNNSGYITRTVNNLLNYYLKSQTYSAEEIDNKISSIPKFSIEVVEQLPTSNISNTTVYLLKSGEETDNLYTEYIRVNGKWEYLGKQTVDLSGYAKESYVQEYAQPKGSYATNEKVGQLEETKVDKDAVFEVRTESTPDYTNQISLSTDENGVVTGGLISGKTVGSDGSIKDNASTYASWFIPVAKGDVIRVKEPSKTSLNGTVTFALYKADKATATGIGKALTTIKGSSVYGTLTVNGNEATWDTSGVSYYPWVNFAYLRITTTSDDVIVTVNEPIVNVEKEILALKSTLKVTKDNLDFEMSDKPMVGKTVVCFGDSLFGMYRGTGSAPSFVAETTGATVHNVGFGGCRMSVHPTSGYSAFSMWALAKAIVENDWTTQDAQASSGSAYFPEQLALLKSIDFSKVDYVVIHYGTNDFGAGTAISIDNANDHDDYNTLCGALRYSVEKLLGKYPQLKIFVSLPVFRFWTENNVTTYSDTYLKHGKKLTEFVEALRSTASDYNLPVIDGYYGLGINKANASTFLSDGTHHNAVGRQRFGEYIGANLISQQTTTKIDGYSRKEIDAMFGSYVDDIASLVGGGA